MKRSLVFCVVALVVCLVAVSASAQDPPKEPKYNYDDSPGEFGNGGIVRNGDDYKQVGEAHGPVGPGPDEEVTDTLFSLDAYEARGLVMMDGSVLMPLFMLGLVF